MKDSSPTRKSKHNLEWDPSINYRLVDDFPTSHTVNVPSSSIEHNDYDTEYDLCEHLPKRILYTIVGFLIVFMIKVAFS